MNNLQNYFFNSTQWESWEKFVLNNIYTSTNKGDRVIKDPCFDIMTVRDTGSISEKHLQAFFDFIKTKY